MSPTLLKIRCAHPIFQTAIRLAATVVHQGDRYRRPVIGCALIIFFPPPRRRASRNRLCARASDRNSWPSSP